MKLTRLNGLTYVRGTSECTSCLVPMEIKIRADVYTHLSLLGGLMCNECLAPFERAAYVYDVDKEIQYYMGEQV